MNLKTLLPPLLLLSLCMATAQGHLDPGRFGDDPNSSFRTIMVNGQKVRYKVILHGIMGYGPGKGEHYLACILPDYSRKSAKFRIRAIAAQFTKQYPKFRYFEFYKSYEVYDILVSSQYPTPEGFKKLREGVLGSYHVVMRR